MPAATSTSSATPNPFTLAADNSPSLLPLLRSSPSLAASQDEHGYSLVHAAASYNHLDLLRCLKAEFDIDPNIVDEDGETALFVVETVEAAQCLIDDVSTDPRIKNAEGLTAEEKIRGEGDFVTVADYLKEVRVRGDEDSRDKPNVKEDGTANGVSGAEHPPPLPPGIQLRVESHEDEQSIGEVADLALRRRIEELASRDDFQGEEGQKQLRDLIADAVRGVSEEQRNVRPRVD
ncbi:MAG: hypothetical protein Q9164_001786 [Protoblastenia rupestris]